MNEKSARVSMKANFDSNINDSNQIEISNENFTNHQDATLQFKDKNLFNLHPFDTISENQIIATNIASLKNLNGIKNFFSDSDSTSNSAEKIKNKSAIETDEKEREMPQFAMRKNAKDFSQQSKLPSYTNQLKSKSAINFLDLKVKVAESNLDSKLDLFTDYYNSYLRFSQDFFHSLNNLADNNLFDKSVNNNNNNYAEKFDKRSLIKLSNGYLLDMSGLDSQDLDEEFLNPIFNSDADIIYNDISYGAGLDRSNNNNVPSNLNTNENIYSKNYISSLLLDPSYNINGNSNKNASFVLNNTDGILSQKSLLDKNKHTLKTWIKIL